VIRTLAAAVRAFAFNYIRAGFPFTPATRIPYRQGAGWRPNKNFLPPFLKSREFDEIIPAKEHRGGRLRWCRLLIKSRLSWCVRGISVPTPLPKRQLAHKAGLEDVESQLARKREIESLHRRTIPSSRVQRMQC